MSTSLSPQKRTRETGVSQSESHTLRNFYDSLPKKYHAKGVEYDSFARLKIKLPANMTVVGGTGSGKTNFVMNFIGDTMAFTRYIICAKMLDEPFYEYLIDKLREQGRKLKVELVQACNNIDDLPSLDSLDEKESTLLIVDDMVGENPVKLAKINQWWIRCRKKNCTSLFLTQDYFRTPKMIRLNSRLLTIVRLDQKRDLKMILKDGAINMDEDQLMKCYKYAVRDGFPNVFMLDFDNPDPAYKFRQNFTPIDLHKVLGRVEGLDGEEDVEATHEELHQRSKKQKRLPKPEVEWK